MIRVATYFLLVFAALLLPLGAALHAGFFGPPPYVLVGDRPGSEWFSERRSPDDGRVLVQRYDSAEEARAAARRLANSIPKSFTNSTGEVVRYRHRESGRAGLVLPVSEFVIHLTAPDTDLLTTHFESLDFIAENPEANWLWVVTTEHLQATVAAGVAYLLLYAVFMCRGAGWAARIAPKRSTSQLSADALRQRILAINDLDVPFRIEEGRNGRLLAQWQVADARWSNLLRSGSLRQVRHLQLELDARARKVRVIETARSMQTGRGPFSFALRFAWSRGVDFSGLEAGRQIGLTHDPERGWVLREDYRYRLDAYEMKAPLIEAITSSGWTWQPVVTFFRPLGG
ncbi:MAG: hypothetical protein JJT88_15680 [Gammaproteobacteria bacterium]|nr:hypothetical protein [Gammaproteobacteria bacterium]